MHPSLLFRIFFSFADLLKRRSGLNGMDDLTKTKWFQLRSGIYIFTTTDMRFFCRGMVIIMTEQREKKGVLHSIL